MWMIILASVLAFFAVLFNLPVVLTVDFRDEFKIWINYLFIKFPIYPKKEKNKKPKPKHDKKNKEKEKKKDSESKKNPFKKLIDRYGISGTVKLMAQVAAEIPKLAFRAIKGARIRKLDIDITVSGSDAAEAGMNYGEISSVFWPAYGTLTKFVSIKKPQIDIIADFDGGESKITVYFKARFTAAHFFTVTFGSIRKIISLATAVNPKKKTKVPRNSVIFKTAKAAEKAKSGKNNSNQKTA